MAVPQQYVSLFRSNYDNRVDDFEIVIYGLFTQDEQQINATAVLSYKDTENILEPIRGAQLDITIDASIAKPLDLFLDFEEQDFIAELYRNGDLIFQGFINPEGVSQSYVNINWQIQLVAVDNIGNLKNIEFNYAQELPTEFIMLDKCLKKTGLDLPIAVFDDINQRRSLIGITTDWGATFDNMFYDRVIDPEVFKNENGRYVSCEDVVIDILQKYNAVLKQESIPYLDPSDNTMKTELCWLFYRPALLSFVFFGNPTYKIKKITGFFPTPSQQLGFQGLFFAPIVENIGLFTASVKRVGTNGQANLTAIHKNANQLIRATRGLQNFRFEQYWKFITNLFNYSFNNFEYIGTVGNQSTYQEQNNKVFLKAVGVFNNNSFDPLQTIESQPLVGYFKHMQFEVPNETRVLKVRGEGLITSGGQNYFAGMQIQVKHTDLQGNEYYLVSPPSSGFYTINQFFIESENTFGLASWVRKEDITPDSSGDLTLTNVSNFLFGIRTETNANVDFSLEFPPTDSEGGTFNIYFSRFFVRTSLLDLPAPASLVNWSFLLNNFEIEIAAPERLGKGEFHDALNQQRVSSKLDEPVSVINADENTGFFRNGLQRVNQNISPATIQNYPYWTTWYYSATNIPRLLELMSIERIRIFSKSQNVFNGDLHGYIPYFCRIINTAYNSPAFCFTKWTYDTKENTIQAEMRELGIKNPSVEYERSFIFEDENNRLIN